MFKPIGLGDRVRDPISGFSGIVTCVSTYLHGCIRITAQAEETKDGKIPDPLYFDQSQLQLVKKGVYAPLVLAVAEAPPAETRRSNGGPAREGPGFHR